MTVNIYRSSDPGAPQLRGYTPGDVINLLNLCLVTGYGSKAAAGWTMPFTSTNVAAFKQGDGNGMYLRVDDSSATANNLRATRCVLYENMSDVNTGTPASVPTSAQLANGIGLFTYYLGTAANARAWKLIATNKFFLLCICPSDTYNINSWAVFFEGIMFGDFTSYKSGDTFNTGVWGCFNSSNSYSQTLLPLGVNSISALSPSGYIARDTTGLGGSIVTGHSSDIAKSNSLVSGKGQLQYPSPVDGGLYLSPIWVTGGGNLGSIRGFLPGLWFCPQNVSGSLNPGDQIAGSGDLAGKTFELWPFGGGSSTQVGCVFVEISNTW